MNIRRQISHLILTAVVGTALTAPIFAQAKFSTPPQPPIVPPPAQPWECKIVRRLPEIITTCYKIRDIWDIWRKKKTPAAPDAEKKQSAELSSSMLTSFRACDQVPGFADQMEIWIVNSTDHSEQGVISAYVQHRLDDSVTARILTESFAVTGDQDGDVWLSELSDDLQAQVIAEIDLSISQCQ